MRIRDCVCRWSSEAAGPGSYSIDRWSIAIEYYDLAAAGDGRQADCELRKRKRRRDREDGF